MVGSGLEGALWLRPVPGQGAQGLRPPPVRVVAGPEGPAVTQTPVLATLGTAAPHHGVRVGAQPDDVVRDARQLIAGVSFVGDGAKTRILRCNKICVTGRSILDMKPYGDLRRCWSKWIPKNSYLSIKSLLLMNNLPSKVTLDRF